MKSKYWIVLFLLLAAVCAGAGILLGRGTPAQTAAIYQDGVLLRTVPLDRDTQFTVPSPDGGSNTVAVADGRIRVEQATCPDKLCVRQGWSDSQNKPIVCLPNGLVIQPEGGGTDLDAVAN